MRKILILTILGLLFLSFNASAGWDKLWDG